MENLITAGELAKLAGTTKRTILFYDEKGVLRPFKVNSKGYRFYSEKQVLDYQKILLLTTLGVSLDEIRKYVRSKGTLTELFDEKKSEIEKEVNRLKFSLNNLNKFTKNIKDNKTLVDPKIVNLDPFEVYYIEKIGPYVKIAEYCKELENMFDKKGSNFVTLAIFENPTYQPKKSKIKVAALAKKGLRLNKSYVDVVKRMTFNPGRVITYTHNGSGTLLSLFWKELEKYCDLNNIKVRKNVPDFEIYRKVGSDPSKQFFEIYLPIK